MTLPNLPASNATNPQLFDRIVAQERELAELALRGFLAVAITVELGDEAVKAMAPHLDRLAELAGAALERCQAVEKLSACYRVETRPSEKLLDGLERTRRRLAAALDPPT